GRNRFGAGPPGGESGLVTQPKRAEIAHHTQRISASRDLRKAVSAITARLERLEQPPPWIFLKEQITEMDLNDSVLHEIEVVIEPLALQIRLVRVPADADVRVNRNVHDPAD